MNERPYSSVLVLASSEDEVNASDSKNLTTLLLVRDIVHKSKSSQLKSTKSGEELTLLGEIRDSKTRDLVSE